MTNPSVLPEAVEGYYDIPGFRFESGEILPELRMGYVRYGTLNATRSNLLLVMPGTGNTRHSAAGHVGPGLAYDTNHYCVVCTDGIGGGSSSRPSAGLGERFPRYTIRDMARAHHRLARDGLALGDVPVAVVAGASMGAFQALEYVIHHPDAADKAVLLVPAGKAGILFQLVVARLTEIIRLDSAWQDGQYETAPVAGLRAAGRHYFPWTVSDDWLDDMDADTAHSACAATGEWFAQWDAWDLIRRYETSASHDIGAPFQGDMRAALARVRVPTLVLACEQDRLLGVAQARAMAAGMARGTFATFASPKGHLAWKAEPGALHTRQLTQRVRAFLGLPVEAMASSPAASLAAGPQGEG